MDALNGGRPASHQDGTLRLRLSGRLDFARRHTSTGPDRSRVRGRTGTATASWLPFGVAKSDGGLLSRRRVSLPHVPRRCAGASTWLAIALRFGHAVGVTRSHTSARVVAVAFRLLGVGAALLVGACSGGSSTTSLTRAAVATTSSLDLPGAAVSFDGDLNLAGASRESSVRCRWPDLDGLSIAVLTTPPDDSVLARIELRSGHVTVILGSTSGEYHERAFTGSGVTAFDPAEGASIDSTLTETAATPGTTAGGIGAVTAIRGAVRCGDQTAGSSTVTLTGETDAGVLSGAMLDPVRVECDATPAGPEVSVSGLTRVGSDLALVSIGLTSDGAVTVDKGTATASRRYVASGIASVTPTGAHVVADTVQQGASAPPHMLHVEGDFVCGRNASG
jgi:hypothetical protein